ncbi:hypothetical protein BKA82DRAFT_4237445 [Pisolithus tinctorius]|nr:hypothetical protein BKA82DRAFT_4237445 [Pisolithus tinctorius]
MGTCVSKHWVIESLQASCHCSGHIILRSASLSRSSVPLSVIPGHRATPMTAVTMGPLKRQIIEKGMLDKWDYCPRKLFVLKSKKLERAIGHSAPGSTALLSYLTDLTLPADHPARADVLKLIHKMETTDWAALVRASNAWPFALEDLLITESFSWEGG